MTDVSSARRYILLGIGYQYLRRIETFQTNQGIASIEVLEVSNTYTYLYRGIGNLKAFYVSKIMNDECNRVHK